MPIIISFFPSLSFFISHRSVIRSTYSRFSILVSTLLLFGILSSQYKVLSYQHDITQQKIELNPELGFEDEFTSPARQSTLIPHSQQTLTTASDNGVETTLGHGSSHPMTITSLGPTTPTVQMMIGSSASPMSSAMTSVPLAVNSHHTIEYVDMPHASQTTTGFVPQQTLDLDQPRQSHQTMIPVSPSTASMIPMTHSVTPSSSSQSFAGQKTYGSRPSDSVARSRGNVIHLPVHSRHTIEYVDVPSTGNYKPLHVEIPPPKLGLSLLFKTTGPKLQLSQSLDRSPPIYHKTHQVDPPIRYQHTVHRPIFENVHTVHSPYRNVMQQIEPVQEDIRTIIPVSSGPQNRIIMMDDDSSSGPVHQYGPI
ncbi:hypothetical protein SSS_09115 [Sarcoptes scabiei]|uniref:Uncharacterized protein n=1 Tax=Sarcoptes scabiei TaxID=52283 RepID=A0A834R696_SARSC|nr:hypothetical protein SSS_09115 [Sarcoptes scabiei]